MSTYFGFIPSTELNEKINNTINITENQPKTPFYPIQLDITNAIAHELLDNLFVYLVDVIEDKARKAKLEKIVNTVRSAVDTMLKHILVEQPNDVVIDSFTFLIHECLFVDTVGNRRIGFTLTDEQASTVIDNFAKARESSEPNEQVQTAMKVIIKANLNHFLNDFSQHLHLSLIKRKAVPIAESAINKASQMAINKLLPQMPYVANIRLIDHFENFIIIKED